MRKIIRRSHLNLTVASPTAKLPNLIHRQYFQLYGICMYTDLLLLMCALSCPPRFLSPTNQRVTDSLIDTVYNDSNGAYSVKDIKRAAHRYYESRRRLGIEDLPDRQEKAAEQRKKRKYRARQQRAYDRYY